MTSSAAIPTVTIGMPVFNGARYLEAAVSSALEQDYPDLEVVIADNGSSDQTVEIARSFAERDPRVRVYQHSENLGAARNYNFVVDEARGRYFRWLAHDDLCGPGLVRQAVELLDSRPDCVLAFARTRYVDDEARTIRDEGPIRWNGSSRVSRLESLLADASDSHLHRCGPVLGFIRTDVLRRTGRIAPHNSSDKTLLVELALHGDWAEISEHLQLRRLHEGNSLAVAKSDADIAAWFDPRHHGKYPMPRTRLFRSYLSAINRTSMPTSERLSCLRVLAGLFRKEWRVIGGEVKIRLRQAMG